MAEKLETAVIIFFRVIDGLILLRFVFSFIPSHPENKLKVFIQNVTEPMLSPVKKIIAHSVIGKDQVFDISPFFAFLLLGFVEFVILQIIRKLL